ncbi:Saccharopine dehydrogenase-domain-containing protein [Polychytrium aggregatum]|uniref:Saccharopine dehydrogenase-domain-containing protein n=1 Tax=Polychytrium aggregatum TaxID=110093 RepID=UPI0022FE748E|nr:Saccharopine dehydrogenase-domain-containing protein [Polychytrium aggregatum]KAI9203816.1 Saccharopine dehydrogenase-domain-containing protein [Polychytrium aggregatum]
MPPIARNERPFDVIREGATGFTGQYVAKHLALNGPAGLKWAIAGRSESKLIQVRNKLISWAGTKVENLPIIIADSGDSASLDAMVGQTRVVASTVGPFAIYGFPLVESCIRMKTDYVDSTGETDFVKKVKDLHHQQAVEAGIKIVSQCGFDSIPSDLGALMIADHLRTAHKASTTSIQLVNKVAKGGVSGGTIASVCNMFSKPIKELRELLDPRILIQDDLPESIAPKSKSTFVEYVPALKAWCSYYFMEGTNIPIVLRSIGLFAKRHIDQAAQASYGNNVMYQEMMVAPLSGNVIAAFILSFVFKFGAALLFLIPPLRTLVQRQFPSGAGPTEEQVEKGYCHIELLGEGITDEAAKPVKARGSIKTEFDPGYGETGKMVAESALCLALDRGKLETADPAVVGPFAPFRGGVLTPATAMGMVLVNRLRRQRMEFAVSSADQA